MFCGTGNIPRLIPHIQTKYGEILCGILLVPQNIVMDMNNVMLMRARESLLWL